MWNESRGRPNIGKDPTGYTSGIAQVSAVVWKMYSGLPYKYAAQGKYYKENLRVAASYLKSLYKQFGDWKLAMEAYNAGPGKLRRVLAGKAHLSNITKRYVAGL